MLRIKFIKIIFPITFILIFSVVIYKINSKDHFIYNLQDGTSEINFEKAEIIDVLDESLEEDENLNNLYRGTQTIEIKILTGKYRGKTETITNYLSDRFNVYGKKGLKIIVSIDIISTGDYNVSVYNYYRTPIIYLIIILFFLFLILIGRKKGVKSIIGLIFTFVCIIYLFVPLLYSGYSPILVSIITIILITIVTVISINGYSLKSLSAVLGTCLGVIIAGIISNIFGYLANISGFNTEEAETLILISNTTHLKVGELLFAGILIASLGAVMDVSMSVISSIYEVYINKPTITIKNLFTSGMNVGKDMMGTMSNTLILAFTGTAINSMILIYSYNVNYNQLMNMNILGIEIIQGMSGSIGIVSTVPLVSIISSYLFKKFSKENNVK
jgi:uncharacterized membrane protein